MGIPYDYAMEINLTIGKRHYWWDAPSYAKRYWIFNRGGEQHKVGQLPIFSWTMRNADGGGVRSVDAAFCARTWWSKWCCWCGICILSDSIKYQSGTWSGTRASPVQFSQAALQRASRNGIIHCVKFKWKLLETFPPKIGPEHTSARTTVRPRECVPAGPWTSGRRCCWFEAT